ncbi:hypothetical protein JBF12_24640, partial [Streptomyces javensis]|nr:hypothetical protein [Streptomyces javensis]
EVYRGKLVLYGCGDMVDDYEGIGGYERYRDDLRLLYFPELDPDTGRLVNLRMVPLRSRRMRLERTGHEDAAWLGGTLDRVGAFLGSHVDVRPDDVLTLRGP